MDRISPLFPERKALPHEVPHWVDSGQEVYFLTLNCRERGRNQLCVPEIAEALIESVTFRHVAGQWFIRLFLLMPDHLHALVSFPTQGQGIQRTVAGWKGWTAKNCGIDWQRDFFEHRLRGSEGFEEKAAYIRNNPVRAGLVETADDWPWVLQAHPQGKELFRGKR